MRGLFGRILETIKPVRRNDAIFGAMLYMGDKLSYWEGKAKFPPSNSEIQVFVYANRDGSLEGHYQFFERVCKEWPKLREAIAPKLYELYRDANAKTLPGSTWEEFVVGSISIPDSSFETAEWDISLEAKSDKAHTYFVEMRGGVPGITSWDS